MTFTKMHGCGNDYVYVNAIAETEKDLKVGKIDCDTQSALAIKYGVSSIPTLIVFKNGKEVNRSVGFMPKNCVMDLVDAVK